MRKRDLPAPSETVLSKAIRDALAYEPDLWLERMQCGQARGLHGGRIHLAAAGTADRVGCLGPGGRFFALETKRPDGTTTPEQEAWMARIRRLGGFAAAVRSVDEARAALGRARKGERE